ncbi:MAG TPA: hypothetical protein VFD04_26935 [Actinomycetes bacterium]|nr:hypothetical protein [Actinomycetes bacterium]
MKGAIALIIGFLLLPGSVYMLLAVNFGALKGYFIAATCFFGFLILLSATWTFGLPGTTPLTGPKGTQPSFRFFTLDDPLAGKYDKVRDFQGAAGSGWQPSPQEPTGGGQLPSSQETLKADLDTAKQAALTKLIADYNKNIKNSSKELDVTNLDPKVFYTMQEGQELVAVVISPKQPPAGSGLRKPTFAPKSSFAYRDPGAPYLPSIIFLVAALVLFAVHVVGLGWVERRRPLGAALTPTEAPARTPAGV